jgi:hypothetical protein
MWATLMEQRIYAIGWASGFETRRKTTTDLIYDEFSFQYHVLYSSNLNKTLGAFEFLHAKPYYAGATRYSNMCDFCILAREGDFGESRGRPQKHSFIVADRTLSAEQS